MSRTIGVPCLKCGAPASPETRDTETPLCWAHDGGDVPAMSPDDFDTQLQAEDSYLDTNGERQ